MFSWQLVDCAGGMGVMRHYGTSRHAWGLAFGKYATASRRIGVISAHYTKFLHIAGDGEMMSILSIISALNTGMSACYL